MASDELPLGFVIRTDPQPFSRDELKELPKAQRLLETAIGGTKYVARGLGPLADESGLTRDQVQRYCIESQHIIPSPRETPDGAEFFGHVARLREKYFLDDTGQVMTEGTRAVPLYKYDVFLSYATEDAELAEELQLGLQESGLNVFVAHLDLVAGSAWADEIRSALRASNVIVALVTPASRSRPWLLLEVGAAWALGRTLVPLLAWVEPTDLPSPLSASQARSVVSGRQRSAAVEEIAQLAAAR